LTIGERERKEEVASSVVENAHCNHPTTKYIPFLRQTSRKPNKTQFLRKTQPYRPLAIPLLAKHLSQRNARSSLTGCGVYSHPQASAANSETKQSAVGGDGWQSDEQRTKWSVKDGVYEALSFYERLWHQGW
jgi:hypothetical protein